MRTADGVLLVYDVTNEDSFEAIDFWLSSLRSCIDENIIIYLLGNKFDLVRDRPNLRKIKAVQAYDYAQRNMIYLSTECSAKDNINIKNMFESFYMGC